ncbi:MAG: DUF4652 domain-containing protein, partial [Clostridia bacterium]
MKKFLCLTLVIFLFTGFFGCAKGDDTPVNASVDDSITNSIALTNEKVDKLEKDVERLETEISTAEKEIDRLEPLLSTAEKENKSLQKLMQDTEEQAKATNVLVLPNNNRLLYTVNKSDYSVAIKYVDGTTVEILKDYMIPVAQPSPDGNKVVLDNYDREKSTNVYLFDVKSRQRKEILLPNLPAGTTASFIDWIDNRYFMFVVMLDHGSVAMGGDVYLYDTENGNYRKIVEPGAKRLQITSFEVIDNDLLIFRAALYDESMTTIE